MAGYLYPSSPLDANQVLQYAFDDAIQCLRTTATLTVPPGGIEVAIDHLTDSIAIGDHLLNNFLTINSDGSINVNVVTSTPGTPQNIYNEVTGVAMNVETTIVTYVVPGGNILLLSGIEVSGDNKATYRVKFDGVVNAKKRTYYTEFNEDFQFNNFSVAAGTTITVTGLHTNASLGAFNARIEGSLT